MKFEGVEDFLLLLDIVNCDFDDLLHHSAGVMMQAHKEHLSFDCMGEMIFRMFVAYFKQLLDYIVSEFVVAEGVDLRTYCLINFGLQ